VGEIEKASRCDQSQSEATIANGLLARLEQGSLSYSPSHRDSTGQRSWIRNSFASPAKSGEDPVLKVTHDSRQEGESWVNPEPRSITCPAGDNLAPSSAAFRLTILT
jgi:hypothetical protein